MVKDTRLYDLLNIQPNVDINQIKKAYKLLALKYHPDKISCLNDKSEATLKFQDITKAYNILSNVEKRKFYDLYGEEIDNDHDNDHLTKCKPSTTTMYTTDLSLSYSNIFNLNPNTHNNNLKKGIDILHTIYCSLKDIYNGCDLKLSLLKKKICY
ncbi:hypothetical protein CANARDRAFT_28549, partial [[Candida] arabinofermentans NRRL YB-2248]